MIKSVTHQRVISGSINLLCVPLGCIFSGILTQPIGKRMAMQVNFVFKFDDNPNSPEIPIFLVDCEHSHFGCLAVISFFHQHLPSLCRTMFSRFERRFNGGSCFNLCG